METRKRLVYSPWNQPLQKASKRPGCTTCLVFSLPPRDFAPRPNLKLVLLAVAMPAEPLLAIGLAGKRCADNPTKNSQNSVGSGMYTFFFFFQTLLFPLFFFFYMTYASHRPLILALLFRLGQPLHPLFRKFISFFSLYFLFFDASFPVRSGQDRIFSRVGAPSSIPLHYAPLFDFTAL